MPSLTRATFFIKVIFSNLYACHLDWVIFGKPGSDSMLQLYQVSLSEIPRRSPGCWCCCCSWLPAVITKMENSARQSSGNCMTSTPVALAVSVMRSAHVQHFNHACDCGRSVERASERANEKNRQCVMISRHVTHVIHCPRTTGLYDVIGNVHCWKYMHMHYCKRVPLTYYGATVLAGLDLT